VLIVETPLSASHYADAAQRNAFYHRVLERIDALPGIRDAAYASYPPLLFKGGRAMISIEGQPAPTPETLTLSITGDRAVSADYFTTIGIPLTRGRLIDDRDAAEAAPVAVINEAMARARWPNEDPVGRRVKLGRPDMLEQPWHTIVGIVGNVRQMGLDVPPEPELYFPLEQVPPSSTFLWPRHLVVHTDGDPLALGLLGVALGLGVAFSLTRLLSSFVYGVSTDSMTFTGVGLLLLLMAALASCLPARRAARIDPMSALRAD
jgi:putative ABC transport system permease protein